MPPSTMAASSKPLLRSSDWRDSSSMANITPANGVLKAAAIPAAPPAIIKPCADTWECAGSQRRAWCMTPEAICTDGPSRPSDKPAKKPQLANTILATLRRIDTYRLTCSLLTWGDRAAMTCGMPDPVAVSYTHLRAHETDSYLVCRLLLEKK